MQSWEAGAELSSNGVRTAHLAAFFGRAARAAGLTTHQIRQYQLARRAAGAATGTINRETSALHRMGTLAVHWGWLDTVPGFPDRLRENPPARASSSTPNTSPSAPTCPPRGRTSSTSPTTRAGASRRSLVSPGMRLTRPAVSSGSRPRARRLWWGGFFPSRRPSPRPWRDGEPAVTPTACSSSTATASPSGAGAQRGAPPARPLGFGYRSGYDPVRSTTSGRSGGPPTRRRAEGRDAPGVQRLKSDDGAWQARVVRDQSLTGYRTESASVGVWPCNNAAFRSDDQLFLARQIESLPPKPPRVVTRATKDSNLQTLLENARELGIDDLLTEAAAFVQNSIPGGYCWPGKLAYAYYLQETTDDDTPTSRSYVALSVKKNEPGRLTLTLRRRAVNAAGQAADEFCNNFSGVIRDRNQNRAVELSFGRDEWAELKEPLVRFFAAMVSGWKRGSVEPEEESA